MGERRSHVFPNGSTLSVDLFVVLRRILLSYQEKRRFVTIMRRFYLALASLLVSGLLVGQEKPDPDAAIKAQLDQAEALGPQVYTYALRRLGGKLKPEELTRRRMTLSQAALSITPWYPIQAENAQDGGNVLGKLQSIVRLYGLDIYLEMRMAVQSKPFTRAEIGEIISTATAVRRHQADCRDRTSDSIRPLFDYWGAAMSRKLVEEKDREYLLGLLRASVSTSLDLLEYLVAMDKVPGGGDPQASLGLGIRVLNQSNGPVAAMDGLFQEGSLVKRWSKLSREATVGSPDAAWGALRSYLRRLLSADYCEASEREARLELVKDFNGETKAINPELALKEAEVKEAAGKGRLVESEPRSALPSALLPLLNRYVEAQERKDSKAAASAWAALKEEWLKFDPKDAVDNSRVFNQQAAIPLIFAMGSGFTGGLAEQEDAVRTLTTFLKGKAARPALRTPWVVSCIALSELARGTSIFGPPLPPAAAVAEVLKKSEIPELVFLANLPLTDDKPSLVP